MRGPGDSGGRLEVRAPDGAPEVRAGDDLVSLLAGLLDLLDGDVVLVTSKVVAKAEGRVVPGTREEHLEAETARLVARRGPTRIVRTHHGLTLAAAGIDASNVGAGTVVLLPRDPDASARRLRAGLRDRTGRDVAVVVTDTAGRAWREGQTDIAVGAAGLVVLDDHAGRVDAHGNALHVTAPAVADQLAGAAELAQGKLAARPFAVVRGCAHLVLPAGDDGPGAATLVRPEGGDLFGWGAREAVVRAVRGEAADAGPYGAPADRGELLAALGVALEGHDLDVEETTGGGLCAQRVGPAALGGLAAVAFAHGWSCRPSAGDGRAATSYDLAPDAAGRPGTP